MRCSLRLPSGARRRARSLTCLVAATILCAFDSPAIAERLPVKHFTAADGLVHDRVMQIVRDSKGFLWFCTARGLSRFDGQRFTSYTSEDGLPIHTLTDLLENSDGSYWVTTNGGGLVKYDPAAAGLGNVTGRGTSSVFRTFPIGTTPATNRINAIYRDPGGGLWLGTDAGLFSVTHDASHPEFRLIPLGIASYPDHVLQVWTMIGDTDGSLWIGSSAGLIRRLRDGRSIQYRIRPVRGSDHVFALMIDRQQRLWIAHDAGLFIVPRGQLEAVTGDRGDIPNAPFGGLAGKRALSLLQTSDDRIWVGSDAGLNEVSADRVKPYGAAHGLERTAFTALAEDAYGNIWAGTTVGATRLARDGLTTYTTADGLDHNVIGSLFETRSGQLCAVTPGSRINVFDGQRFRAILPRRRRQGDIRGDSYYGVALYDRAGEWWIPSGDRLFRFPAVDATDLAVIEPQEVYTLPGAPASRGIWRLFEDRRGDLWIARRVVTSQVVARLERKTGKLHHYSANDGLPISAANTFAEDAAGNLWIGFWDSGLARLRHGRFRTFSLTDVAQSSRVGVSSLHVDRASRLWVGTTGGLVRIDDPDADLPRFMRYSTEQGLADNGVRTLAEDHAGNLYVGTVGGVDRLDPRSGRIRHFSTADGLASLETRVAYRDRQGRMWFATERGLSRLIPQRDRPQLAAAALIQHVRIDGQRQPVSDAGVAELGPFTAASPRSRIEIDFFALSFQPGEAPRYQYRLNGIEAWSPPTAERTVTYPRLAPGTYQFSVRAVRSDGAPGPHQASVGFTIPPPIWGRWWFLALMATGVILGVHAVYRRRLSRLLEIERIRTRLAMDLHDDIGSTLSQVAVLSEVARNRVTQDRRLTELLERLGEISRHLIDAMSDVVWAINPERDSVRDLVQRMRRFGSDTLDSQNIQFRLDAPAEDLSARLDAHLRRDVFLIYKEGITNLARYSKCARADVALQIDRGSMTLTIADDGIGVDSAVRGNGLGLRSMQERAARLRGDLTVSSAPGNGTRVRVIVPLGRRRPMLRLRHGSTGNPR